MKSGLIKNLAAVGFAAVFIWIGCGHPPEPEPAPYTGSVRVTALDSLLIDSINITIDDDYRGRFKNPHLIENLLAGDHKFNVSTRDASANTQMVAVLRDKLTRAFFNIELSGPYINRAAPDFLLTDIDGNRINLSGLRGKVVLLAFFEHT